MSETRDVRPAVKAALVGWDPQPVENRVGSGMPDLNYIHGWIELKYMRHWPKGADVNPVRFTHPLLVPQRVWINRRLRCGGRVHVLVKVSHDWLLFTGAWAAEHLERVNRLQMFEAAVFHSAIGLKKKRKELRECLLAS